MLSVNDCDDHTFKSFTLISLYIYAQIQVSAPPRPMSYSSPSERNSQRGHRRQSFTASDINELVEIRARQRTFHGAYSRTALGSLGYALTILRLFDNRFRRSTFLFFPSIFLHLGRCPVNSVFYSGFTNSQSSTLILHHLQSVSYSHYSAVSSSSFHSSVPAIPYMTLPIDIKSKLPLTADSRP